MMSIITARILHDRITFLPQTRLTFVKTFIPALDPELIKCGYILMQVKFLFNISHVWFHLRRADLGLIRSLNVYLKTNVRVVQNIFVD